MSLGKKDISKNISTKAHISLEISEQILNTFLVLLKKNTLNTTVKISNFGTFERKVTPQRIGRNPVTKKEFVIKQRLKLAFKSSNTIKTLLN
ncbi:HU family DNA-binding protein [Gammaproteobacteria bacterium]|nr:HU family DNA-binding protein [Gammaproteobacteria bacterium]